MAIAAVGFAGCSGDDGKDGDPGPTGPTGPTGPVGPPGAGLDPVAASKPESCGTCHQGVGESIHQSVYDMYSDESNLGLTITGVSSVKTSVDPAPAEYTVTMAFSVTQNGQPYVDAGLSGLDQKRFYVQGYDSTADADYPFPQQWNANLSTITSLGGGNYTAERTGVSFDPTALTGYQAYGYVAEGPLDTEGMTLYDNVANAGLAFGDADTYVSAANVEGCEACHGTPYMKHGYRAAAVDGLPTFAACKSCHYDDGNGGHPDWQWMVDDPATWAPAFLAKEPAPDDVKARYAYKRTVMNDVHMSHAMEFPYPMSMVNCATCHEGKLDQVLDDEYFTGPTCKSCHPVQAQADYPTQANRAPALEALWEEAGQLQLHQGFPDLNTATCTSCHGNFAGSFSDYHTGYNKEIYTEAGEKYSELFTASVDSVSLNGNILDIRFSANSDAIVPQVTVSFYGYGTKDFLIACHTRDANGLRMEKTIGTDNALFTEEADSVPGNWHVTLDIAAYAPSADTGLESIPAAIAAGKISKAEVAVLPTLTTAADPNLTLALNAPSKTVDVSADGVDQFVANYFQGDNALADVTKCNKCHDALASTFHSGNRGGNIVVCRTCHVVTSGGSHLEMQSRSIDGYVHAIHRFQDFDTGDIDFTDPVEAARYELHIEHTFPNFTIKNCEGCHVTADNDTPVKYNVPDQSKSMPHLMSAADEWNVPRNIGAVPEYVAGPASAACGGCHRAEFIKEDAAGELASFNSHTATFGTLAENDGVDEDGNADDSVLYGIIDKIMGMF